MTITRIQARRGTTAEWAAENPLLAAGEPGLDTTLKRWKIGDGSTLWASLPFYPAFVPVLTPTSSADTQGNNGDCGANATHFFVKVGGSWLRVPLETF